MCTAILTVAERRGWGSQTAYKKLDTTPAEFMAYRNATKALHFDIFFAWCHTLQVSPHSVFARAQIMFEERVRVKIKTTERSPRS